MKIQKIGFVGGGNMAISLVGGLISNGYPIDSITVSDLDEAKLQFLADKFGINITRDSKKMSAEADVLVLAVKPQHMQSVAEQIKSSVQLAKPVVVSIAAGIRESSLEAWLGDLIPVVRCMPNTPALVKTGATGLHANRFVSEAQKDQTESLLRAVGVTVWVNNESDLDIVTALSGSGPAYFFLVMEVLEQAAIEAGLDQKTAQLLTQETALGAAKMALASSESAATLRRQVTSPGGTTEKAIGVMESQGLPEILRDAVVAAKERSVELSDELGGM